MFKFDFHDVAMLKSREYLGLAPDECALTMLGGPTSYQGSRRAAGAEEETR